jgi:hypothetical protein
MDKIVGDGWMYRGTGEFREYPIWMHVRGYPAEEDIQVQRRAVRYARESSETGIYLSSETAAGMN